MHDVGLPHCHAEEMFKASGDDDSFKKNFDMQMIFQFWVMVDFSKVSHV